MKFVEIVKNGGLAISLCDILRISLSVFFLLLSFHRTLVSSFIRLSFQEEQFHLDMNRFFCIFLASTAIVSAFTQDPCASSCVKAMKSFTWSGCEDSKTPVSCCELPFFHIFKNRY